MDEKTREEAINLKIRLLAEKSRNIEMRHKLVQEDKLRAESRGSAVSSKQQSYSQQTKTYGKSSAHMDELEQEDFDEPPRYRSNDDPRRPGGPRRHEYGQGEDTSRGGGNSRRGGHLRHDHIGRNNEDYVRSYSNESDRGYRNDSDRGYRNDGNRGYRNDDRGYRNDDDRGYRNSDRGYRNDDDRGYRSERRAPPANRRHNRSRDDANTNYPSRDFQYDEPSSHHYKRAAEREQQRRQNVQAMEDQMSGKLQKGDEGYQEPRGFLQDSRREGDGEFARHPPPRSVRYNPTENRNRHQNRVPHGDRMIDMTGRQRQDYDRWKQQQDEADKQRLSRSQGEGGKWRRDWDSEKTPEDFEEEQRERRGDHSYRRGRGRGGFNRNEARRPEQNYGKDEHMAGDRPPRWQHSDDQEGQRGEWNQRQDAGYNRRPRGRGGYNREGSQRDTQQGRDDYNRNSGGRTSRENEDQSQNPEKNWVENARADENSGFENRRVQKKSNEEDWGNDTEEKWGESEEHAHDDRMQDKSYNRRNEPRQSSRSRQNDRGHGSEEKWGQDDANRGRRHENQSPASRNRPYQQETDRRPDNRSANYRRDDRGPARGYRGQNRSRGRGNRRYGGAQRRNEEKPPPSEDKQTKQDKWGENAEDDWGADAEETWGKDEPFSQEASATEQQGGAKLSEVAEVYPDVAEPETKDETEVQADERSETPQQSFQDNFVDTFQRESVDSDASQHSERSKSKNPGNLKVQIEPKDKQTKTKQATNRKTSLTSPLKTPENLQPVGDWALEVEVNSPNYVLKEEPVYEAAEKPEETAKASDTAPETHSRSDDSATLLQSEEVGQSDQQLPQERFADVVTGNDVTSKSDDDDDDESFATADSDQDVGEFQYEKLENVDDDSDQGFSLQDELRYLSENVKITEQREPADAATDDFENSETPSIIQESETAQAETQHEVNSLNQSDRNDECAQDEDTECPSKGAQPSPNVSMLPENSHTEQDWLKKERDVAAQDPIKKVESSQPENDEFAPPETDESAPPATDESTPPETEKSAQSETDEFAQTKNHEFAQTENDKFVQPESDGFAQTKNDESAQLESVESAQTENDGSVQNENNDSAKCESDESAQRQSDEFAQTEKVEISTATEDAKHAEVGNTESGGPECYDSPRKDEACFALQGAVQDENESERWTQSDKSDNGAAMTDNVGANAAGEKSETAKT